ncbi:Bug family tripartite tricarboxylate transporter substrate binding protein [Ottowia thiooxydans]|uniref:Tripartite-type tricarboxylate transporter receptor subunit TctC n=1 Tax=Ottowia thiooxydans TaxID=219182 RepID=A0ABV2Q2C3_9BURK
MSRNLRSVSRRTMLSYVAAPALALPAAAAWAWPDKQINMVLGYAAGGSVDAVARLIAPALSNRLGQSIVIENLGGVGGALGATRVARAAPDAHTLMLGSTSEVCIAWAVNPNLKYNGLTDLAPVGNIASSGLVLVGNKGIPRQTTPELLQYVKSNPGKVSLATVGVGTPHHLMLEYINRMTGTDILHVPYRSAASITTDVISGRVSLSLLSVTTALPFIESGQLHAFAVTSKLEDPALPGVPPLSRVAGLKDAVFELFYGMFAPANTPQALLEKLNTELNAILKTPDIQQALLKQGIVASGGSIHQFKKQVRDDSEKYQQIIKSAGITLS